MVSSFKKFQVGISNFLGIHPCKSTIFTDVTGAICSVQVYTGPTMSESQSAYDPMSLHGEIDEIYMSQVTQERLDMRRRVMNAERDFRRKNRYSLRNEDIIVCPELFGDFGSSIDRPPVAPD